MFWLCAWCIEGTADRRVEGPLFSGTDVNAICSPVAVSMFPRWNFFIFHTFSNDFLFIIFATSQPCHLKLPALFCQSADGREPWPWLPSGRAADHSRG